MKNPSQIPQVYRTKSWSYTTNAMLLTECFLTCLQAFIKKQIKTQPSFSREILPTEHRTANQELPLFKLEFYTPTIKVHSKIKIPIPSFTQIFTQMVLHSMVVHRELLQEIQEAIQLEAFQSKASQLKAFQSKAFHAGIHSQMDMMLVVVHVDSEKVPLPHHPVS